MTTIKPTEKYVKDVEYYVKKKRVLSNKEIISIINEYCD
jgi:hypothetical protein